LLTKDVTPNTFHIGVDDVNKCVKEITQLLEEDKSFAILMPVSITSEISRLENKDGQRCHDENLAIKVKSMSKITLASSSEVWLINLPGTIKLAANLSIPHHEGAGGEEDFDCRESFQKHVKRVSSRLKRKR
jgi:hypothetical protein